MPRISDWCLVVVVGAVGLRAKPAFAGSCSFFEQSNPEPEEPYESSLGTAQYNDWQQQHEDWGREHEKACPRPPPPAWAVRLQNALAARVEDAIREDQEQKRLAAIAHTRQVPVLWIGPPCALGQLPIPKYVLEEPAMRPRTRDCVRASEALAYYEKGCSGPDGEWCHEEATALAFGNGVPVDLERAAAAYDRGCQAGHVAASCVAFGLMLESGAEPRASLETAPNVYNFACSVFKSEYACMRLAEMYIFLANQPSRAVGLLELACSQSNMRACVDLGQLYESGSGGVPKQHDHALALYKRACFVDPASGCSGLAHAYEIGMGVGRDAPKAIELYRLGCESDDPLACASLARLFAHGRGVPKDEAQAKQLLEKSCREGFELSCSELSGRSQDATMQPNIQALLLDADRGDSEMSSVPSSFPEMNQRVSTKRGDVSVTAPSEFKVDTINDSIVRISPDDPGSHASLVISSWPLAPESRNLTTLGEGWAAALATAQYASTYTFTKHEAANCGSGLPGYAVEGTFRFSSTSDWWIERACLVVRGNRGYRFSYTVRLDQRSTVGARFDKAISTFSIQ